jgi:hypothetical protein
MFDSRPARALTREVRASATDAFTSHDATPPPAGAVRDATPVTIESG